MYEAMAMVLSKETALLERQRRTGDASGKQAVIDLLVMYVQCTACALQRLLDKRASLDSDLSLIHI